MPAHSALGRIVLPPPPCQSYDPTGLLLLMEESVTKLQPVQHFQFNLFLIVSVFELCKFDAFEMDSIGSVIFRRMFGKEENVR